MLPQYFNFRLEVFAMDWVVIAIFKENETKKGLRVLNKGTKHVSYIPIDRLEEALNKGYKFSNIGIVNGELKWTEGSKNRYPVICGETGKVKNGNSIIVLGRLKSGNIIEYIVSNYEGSLRSFKEDELIAYGKRFKLANCKVGRRGDKEYIASIRGDIEELSEVVYRYDIDNRRITAEIYNKHTNKLVIPQKIDGRIIESISSIVVVPEQFKANIVSLVFPKTLESLGRSIGEGFLKVRNIYFTGPINYAPLEKFKSLRNIIIEKLNTFHKQLRLKSEAKSIRFKVKPTVYGEGLFKGCKNLDMKDLLHEGLLEIREETFYGADQLIDVELPVSLKVLDSSAFKKCRNIRSLKINSNTLNIIGDIRDKDSKLLSHSNNAVLYCSGDFPLELLNKYVAPHVRIIRGKSRKLSDEVERKLLKSAMMGVGLRKHGVVSDEQGLMNFLSMMDEERFKEEMYKAIETVQRGRETITRVENQSTYINVEFRGALNYMLDSGQIVRTKNYLIMMFDRMAVIYLISLEKIKSRVYDMILGQVGFNRMDGICSKNDRYGFILTLPYSGIQILKEEIVSIEEVDEQVAIKTVKGEETKVKL